MYMNMGIHVCVGFHVLYYLTSGIPWWYIAAGVGGAVLMTRVVY